LKVGYNGATGITTGRGVRITDSSSGGNIGDGIFFEGGGMIVGANTNNNSAGGITAGDNTIVRGAHASANGGVGIAVGHSSMVMESQANYNGIHGLEFDALLGTTVGYGNNVMIGNTIANTSGTGVQLGSNVCGTALCP
jgi:hypothetical protein